MNSSERKNYEFNSLFEMISNLKKIIFSLYPKVLLSNPEKQEYFNNMLMDYSKKIGVNNLDEENEKYLKINNKLYSCLNLLSIAGKSAHILDEDIQKASESFIKMYESYSGIHLENVSFMKDFNEVCPEIKNINKEIIKFINKLCEKEEKNITDNEFKRIYSILDKNTYTDIKDIKLFISKGLGIDPKNDQNAIDLYELLKENKTKIFEAYLFKKYNYGKSLLNLQNEMFAVKNYYLEMTAELLKEGNLNINYYLAKTEEEKEGFTYSLIIDDKENSNHIELPLSDYMLDIFVKEFNFKKEEKKNKKKEEKKTKKKEEKKTKKKELNKTTNIIEQKPTEVLYKSLLRSYLYKYDIHKYDDILKFADGIVNNENYPLNVTMVISSNYYMNVYQSLDPKEQNLFILDSLYNPHEEYDELDKVIINKLKILNEKEKTNNNLIAEILITKEQIKDSFNKEEKITFEEYIDKYIDEHNIVENKNEKRRNK